MYDQTTSGASIFANGAVTGAFSRLFNDEAHSESDVVYGQEEVLTPTGRDGVAWQGIDKISEWTDIPVDSIVEFFIKRDVPALTVQFGTELGYSKYEYQVGLKSYQVVVEGLGVTNKSYLPGIIPTNETRWLITDSVVATRTRWRMCAPSCK